jgi:hypothetical protein
VAAKHAILRGKALACMKIQADRMKRRSANKMGISTDTDTPYALEVRACASRATALPRLLLLLLTQLLLLPTGGHDRSGSERPCGPREAGREEPDVRGCRGVYVTLRRPVWGNGRHV